jgi:hypothetical protein
VRVELEPILAGSYQRLVRAEQKDYTHSSRKKLYKEDGNRMVCVEMYKHYIKLHSISTPKRNLRMQHVRSCFLVRPTLI